MSDYAYPESREKVLSGAAAFAMHLLFLALLVFGVNWQRTVEPQANLVDLWANLPSQTQPKVEQPPPEPPPPQPVKPPKVEPPPPPKAVVKPEIAKPDIAMKEKAEKEKVEKERRITEEKQKAAKKAEETAKAEQKAKEVAETQHAKEQQELQAKLAQQAFNAQATQIDKYKRAMSDRIKRFIVLPPNMQGNPEAEFEVVILPGGEVLNAKLKKPSGNTAYDSAVERAILKAQPLPLPPDPAMFKDFRELNLRFRPQE